MFQDHAPAVTAVSAFIPIPQEEPNIPEITKQLLRNRDHSFDQLLLEKVTELLVSYTSSEIMEVISFLMDDLVTIEFEVHKAQPVPIYEEDNLDWF